MKPVLRAGLDAAGIGHRLVDGQFVYIDKNVVALLGGEAAAARSGVALDHGPVAVQVTDVEGALAAADAGCRIVMVDTGTIAMLADVHHALTEAGLRDQCALAFGGGVDGTSLHTAHAMGADIVDIGRAILDAPLWDLHLEVVE
jgi:nicotinate-nucleotide pyrophosphorylase (carboxylating)